MEDKSVFRITSDIELAQLADNIKNCPTKNVALNLKQFKFFNPQFIDIIKDLTSKKIISLTNTPLEVHALINLLQYDKYFDIYIDDESFLKDKHKIINRKFRIV